jgi:hypothetical protein
MTMKFLQKDFGKTNGVSSYRKHVYAKVEAAIPTKA